MSHSSRPPDKRTREALEDAVRALARGVEVLADLAQAEHASDPLSAHRLRSRIPEWRTYPGFRGDMLHREREYLRHNLPPAPKLALANQTGNDSEKSINRHMLDYGLDPVHDWPPSTWPEHEPRHGHDGHVLAALVSGVFATQMMDVISDGRLNQAIKFVWELCRPARGQF